MLLMRVLAKIGNVKPMTTVTTGYALALTSNNTKRVCLVTQLQNFPFC